MFLEFIWFIYLVLCLLGSTCNVGDSGDASSVPGSGRSPAGGNGNYSCILAWKIPWTEQPGRIQSMGSQRVEHN